MSALTQRAPVRELVECYPAIPSSIGRARYEIGAFADLLGLAPTQSDSVRLAVSEAVTNVVRHAYAFEGGAVQLEATVAGGELNVRVVDDGHGMATPTRSPGLGVGLSLISAVADSVSVTERPGGGTEIRMGFGLGRPV